MSKNVKWWGPLLLALAACSDAPTAIVADGSQAADRAKTPALVSGVTVAMSNLDSPRGLAFGPEGALYVAEAGTADINGPCTPVLRGQNCYSGTGAVSRLWKGRQERVVSGLPSVYNPSPAT